MSQPRRKSVPVSIGPVRVGGRYPIVVQSMTNTDTADVEGTAQQVKSLARAGSEPASIALVRMCMRSRPPLRRGVHASRSVNAR